MPKPHVKKATASFQTQGRLLQELGERLVSKSDVALLELIKNAYDADASICRVISDSQHIEIIDDGHGMSEQEFLDNWMHIATPEKQRSNESKRYKRAVTGSKGIGRFAVRFLGRHLRLETVALSTSGQKKMVVVDFNWVKIDEAIELHTFEIPYEVRTMPARQGTGTRLIITELRKREDIQLNKIQKTELLSIINPYSGLESGGFQRYGKSENDPGFKVILPEAGSDGEKDIAVAVLSNYFAKLTIEHKNDNVQYIVKHKDGRELLKREIEYPSHISKGFFADIRFCPRRIGMFRDTGFDGRSLYGWLQDHGGIGIVDHGFRMRPYGFPDDDWLNLGLDSGHSRRKWRVDFMNKLYPMPDEASSEPKNNPMLYLPMFHQLIGAVFVESTQDFDIDPPKDLTPAMDREGFIDNEAFEGLFELVRAGLEMLAFADHREKRRIEKEVAQIKVEEMRHDLKAAVQYVEKIPSLSENDRQQVIDRFQTLTKELYDVQDYHRVATSKLEVIALLGVLAGFLTHEMKRLIHDFDIIIEDLKSSMLTPPLQEKLSRMLKVRDEIAGQIQFAATYISNVQAPKQGIMPLNTKSQVNRILDRFRFFTEERDVRVDCDMDDDLMTPAMPVALYSGVILNLFTNALKAIFGGQGASGEPRIVIKAWNLPKFHVLEVADTGIGIPPTLRKRIWDPLYTTTSGGSSNPLGSGMGLGLTLVKRLLSDVKGRIELVDPPPEYNTCFRVQFAR